MKYKVEEHSILRTAVAESLCNVCGKPAVVEFCDLRETCPVGMVAHWQKAGDVQRYCAEHSMPQKTYKLDLSDMQWMALAVCNDLGQEEHDRLFERITVADGEMTDAEWEAIRLEWLTCLRCDGDMRTDEGLVKARAAFFCRHVTRLMEQVEKVKGAALDESASMETVLETV